MHAIRTRVSVEPEGDDWVIRRDGLFVDRYRVRRIAVDNARQLARQNEPATLEVQSKRHGTWHTKATYGHR